VEKIRNSKTKKIQENNDDAISTFELWEEFFFSDFWF